jgi:predicted phage terminase large subunit-like protein
MGDREEGEARRRLLELEQEQWHRQCRQSFISFCIEALSARGETPALHHRLICSEVEAIARGKRERLMILAPPGSAKTTYVSRLFPAWFFAFRPNSSIIACSHTASLSELNSGHVQRIVRENSAVCDYSLLQDSSDANSSSSGRVSKERWHTSNSCVFHAGSVGSAILGLRANLAIIDDPIRSRADAESEVVREATWQWFTNDLQTRLTPDGAIILIATPFHEDDLMGRLQRLQTNEWRVLRLPAIADEPDDPLGRQIGEPLWSDDQYGYGPRLLEIQAAAEREGRSNDWYAQYQGLPRPPGGSLFKTANVQVFDLLPGRVLSELRSWDLASSTKSTSDYTVGLKLAQIRLHGSDVTKWMVTDVHRFRGGPEEVERRIKAVADVDGYVVPIRLPEDPGSAGQSLAHSYIRLLAGFDVRAIRMTGDKAQRAHAAAAQLNIGRIGLMRAPWNAALIDELSSFPSGRHDDQVDALSLGFEQLAAKPPMRISAEALREFGIFVPPDLDPPSRSWTPC